ncbi:Lsr2 family protein [Streptomyces chattanoogensis]|uniref:histone-like nucleoid-structuring protein Lsr2 n=1 Tax=Streptomyces chattanoogensis TaxID=66876 RepID=UPI0036864947
MAQKIVTLYIDDLTGEEAQEAATHTFSLDGVSYEIDLGPESYEQMLQAFGPFIKASRKVGRTRKPSKATTGASRDDSAAIRAWAKEAGYDVSDRGRVPADVREAYDKAH